MTLTCKRCGKTKPEDEFYRKTSSKTGRHSWCKDCSVEFAQDSQARRRREMGDEAYLAHRREIVQRSREKLGAARDRANSRAYNRALNRLRKRHRNEFADLLAEERRKLDSPPNESESLTLERNQT